MLYSQSPPLADNDAAPEEPRRFARDQEDRSEPQFGRRPIHAYPAPPRPSFLRRTFRTLTRFTIAVLIGVGATLGWQAYGDMGKQMLAAHAPEQAWLLAYLPATRPPAARAAAASPALQLEPLASNIDFVRRSVEQLALKQDQMARNIAALQAVDEDIRQKVTSSPAAAPAQPTAAPPPQPAAASPLPKPAPPKPQAAPGAQRPAASAAPVSLLPR